MKMMQPPLNRFKSAAVLCSIEMPLKTKKRKNVSCSFIDLPTLIKSVQNIPIHSMTARRCKSMILIIGCFHARWPIPDQMQEPVVLISLISKLKLEPWVFRLFVTSSLLNTINEYIFLMPLVLVGAKRNWPFQVVCWFALIALVMEAATSILS